MEKLLTDIMIALFAFNYLNIAYGIQYKNNQNNFATYILWLAFDGLALYNTYQNHENLVLTFTFIIGTALVALVLALKKSFTWTWVETLITILVIVCMCITQVSSPKIALNATAIGLGIAGLPYWKDLLTRKASDDEVFNGWIYLIALLIGSITVLMRHETPTIAVVGFFFWVGSMVIMYTRKFYVRIE